MADRIADFIDLERPPELVAPELLGCSVVCRGTAAVIVEAEAYHESEPAAHSYGRRITRRTQHLFGPPGTCYVYFTYGMHWCMNVVTGREGEGAAVLLRAAIPLTGVDLMRERRGRDRLRELCAGPARLVQALDVRETDGGRSMFDPRVETVAAALRRDRRAGPIIVRDVEAARSVGVELPLRAAQIATGRRIGISKAVELPWRFGLAESAWTSKPFS